MIFERVLSVFLLSVILLPTVNRLAHAQPFSLSLQDTTLSYALTVLDEQADETLVYTSRLVGNQRVSCVYDGVRFEEALACVLAGTGLQGERVRRNQYVIAAESPAADNTAAAPRGTVAGFVVDAETREVLPGAHVFLTELGVGIVANGSGYFAFGGLPRGSYRTRVSYIGYELLETQLVVGQTPAELALRPIAVEGETVVIEGEQNAVEPVVPGLLSVPVQELEALPSFPGEQDLIQALQWMPGVRKSGEITGGLLVRGGEPDQNLYLLEDAPIYHPWHAFSLISTFQTETFKNVRLYRGAFPAEYGGRLSSVLDVQMKDGAQDRPRASVGLSLVAGRFVAEAPIGDNASMMVSARRSYLDQIVGREHPVEGSDGRLDTLRTGYYFFDVSTKWTYRPSSRHRLTLAYYEGTDDLDLRLPFDLSLTVGSWLRPADLFFELDHVWGNRMASLKHSFLVGSDFFLTTTGYYSAYAARERTYVQPTSTSSVASTYDVRLDEVGLKVDVDRYHSISHQLRGGLQVVRRVLEGHLDARIHPTPGSADALEQSSTLAGWEAAAYLQDAWKPSPRLQVLLGLRTSYFGSGDHLNVLPSVSAAYRLRPNVVVRASAGTHVQYMHRLRDRYSFMYDLVSSRWISSTASVAPSHSAQLTAGAAVDLTPQITINSDVYLRRSYGILVPEDIYRTKDGLDGPGIEVGALLGQYEEADGRAYGVEVGAHLKQPLWDLLVSYTGGRTLVRTAEEGASYRPSRYDVPRSLRVVAAFRPGNWSVSLSGDVRSGYPYSVPEARYALGDPLDSEPVRYLYRPVPNNGRLPGYGRIDFSLGYRFLLIKGRWEAKLHLYNALNRRNIISRSFDPSGEYVVTTNRRGLPLLPLLEIEVDI